MQLHKNREIFQNPGEIKLKRYPRPYTRYQYKTIKRKISLSIRLITQDYPVTGTLARREVQKLPFFSRNRRVGNGKKTRETRIRSVSRERDKANEGEKPHDESK